MWDAETLARSGARIIQLSVLVVVSTNTSANPTEVGSATGTSLAPSSVAVYLKVAASACGEDCAIRVDPRNAERIAERKRTFFMTYLRMDAGGRAGNLAGKVAAVDRSRLFLR